MSVTLTDSFSLWVNLFALHVYKTSNNVFIRRTNTNILLFCRVWIRSKLLHIYILLVKCTCTEFWYLSCECGPRPWDTSKHRVRASDPSHFTRNSKYTQLLTYNQPNSLQHMLSNYPQWEYQDSLELSRSQIQHLFTRNHCDVIFTKLS